MSHWLGLTIVRTDLETLEIGTATLAGSAEYTLEANRCHLGQESPEILYGLPLVIVGTPQLDFTFAGSALEGPGQTR